MKEKYMKVQLGTGYCGEETIQYYKLEDQNKTKTTNADWCYYEELALDWNEHYGREYTDYCEEQGVDPDDTDYWDEYVTHCSESGYIEIVEIDPEDDDAFTDGWLEPQLW